MPAFSEGDLPGLFLVSHEVAQTAQRRYIAFICFDLGILVIVTMLSLEPLQRNAVAVAIVLPLQISLFRTFACTCFSLIYN